MNAGCNLSLVWLRLPWGRSWSQWGAHGVPMGAHGFAWVPMRSPSGPHGLPGFPWNDHGAAMWLHRVPWVCMCPHGPHGPPLVCIGPHWVCMGPTCSDLPHHPRGATSGKNTHDLPLLKNETTCFPPITQIPCKYIHIMMIPS